MKEELTHFNKLFSINCNDKTEKKSNGSTELTYLSWTYAWAEVKKIFPNTGLASCVECTAYLSTTK